MVHARGPFLPWTISFHLLGWINFDILPCNKTYAAYWPMGLGVQFNEKKMLGLHYLVAYSEE